jgi:hypothetical protein
MGLSCYTEVNKKPPVTVQPPDIPGIKPKQKFDPYNVVIDVTSIKNLNNPGWNIIYHGKKNEQKSNIHLKSKIVISVLGNSNRGKTYLLQLLSGSNLESGYQVQTKGLSLKFYNDLIFLDTAGTNIPLLLEEGQKRLNEAEIQNVKLCQIITNYIIQKFVVEYADILICVVGMLNAKEQIYLNKIKKLCEDKKELIVIHNLVKCESCEDIEKYKNETLLKMISCKLIEMNIPGFGDNNENLFNKYFIEEDNKHVKHFIFANDDKTKSKELEKYNKTTLNFIKTNIKIQKKKQKDFLKNFLKHIEDISSSVLKQKISPIIENDIIKCNEKEIIPKKIKADELDNIIFIGKEYEPLYRFYRRGKYFVFEIQICIKKYDIKKVEHEYVLGKETKFIAEGTRKLDLFDEKEYLTNKRVNFTNFKIITRVKLHDFGIVFISKEPAHIELKNGILFYIYKIKKELK